MTKDSAGETRYVSPENLVSSFQALGRSMAVTHGRYEMKVSCEVRDADWNHMDQLHRPAVHKTYQESLRLVTDHSFQLSLTNVGFGGFKFFVLVTDIRLGPGLFYQGFSLLNLLYVHSIIRMMPVKEGTLQSIDWYTVSHRWFKFLHGPVSRRLYRLNDIQNKEDVSVRIRRAELRRKGYHFGSDQPDFLNSNILTDNVISPKLEEIHRIPLKGITEAGLKRISAGPIEFLVRKNSAEKYTIWPSVCPHEGGPMESGEICNGTIICPWHSLKQAGATLTPDRPRGFLSNLELLLEGDELVVRQRD